MDISQVLYIHEERITVKSKATEFEIGPRTRKDSCIIKPKDIEDFDPLTEKAFFESLDDPYKRHQNKFLLKDGLTPGTKDFTKTRAKKEEEVDKLDMKRVTKEMRNIAKYGFSDKVQESLLHFDAKGNLINEEKYDWTEDKDVSIVFH